jgi:hypothetical protein
MLTILLVIFLINKITDKMVENEFNVPKEFKFHIVENNGKFEPEWEEA